MLILLYLRAIFLISTITMITLFPNQVYPSYGQAIKTNWFSSESHLVVSSLNISFTNLQSNEFHVSLNFSKFARQYSLILHYNICLIKKIYKEHYRTPYHQKLIKLKYSSNHLKLDMNIFFIATKMQ